MVSVDIGPHIREQVCAITSLGNRGPDARKFAAVFEKDLAVAGEVVLAGCRGCEGRVAIEEAGELRY